MFSFFFFCLESDSTTHFRSYLVFLCAPACPFPCGLLGDDSNNHMIHSLAFNSFFLVVQVCPHDVRLLSGEHIVAAHATAPGETIIGASIADPHVLLHLSTGAAQVLCAVVEGGGEGGGAVRAALEVVGVVPAADDPILSCCAYADTSGMFRIVRPSDSRRSASGATARGGNDGGGHTATPAVATPVGAGRMMDVGGDDDDIDAMLYGDDDDDEDDAVAPTLQRTASKPATAAAASTPAGRADGASAAGAAAGAAAREADEFIVTHWCVVARASGALEVLQLPNLEARFTFRLFMTIPRTLVDDGEMGRGALVAGTQTVGLASAGQTDDAVDLDEMGGMAGDSADASAATATRLATVVGDGRGDADVDLDDAAAAAAAAVAIEAAAATDAADNEGDGAQQQQPQSTDEGDGATAASTAEEGSSVTDGGAAGASAVGPGEDEVMSDARPSATADYPWVREVVLTGLGGGSRPCLVCRLSSGHFAVYEAFRAVKIAHEGRLGLRFRKLDSDLFFNEPELFNR